MYNPGITIPAPGTGYAANSKIDIIDISTDGAKAVIFNVTTPWNTIAPDGGGTEGDTFKWTSGNYVLMMKIMTVNETARTATFRLLSYARVSTPYFTTTVTGLPSSAAPGSVLNYTFQVTNNTSSSTLVRWIFGSQESTGTGTWADWIEPEQLESFPPTTIVRNKNCWYEDWATGGICATGQTIMAHGFITISGNLTVLAAAGKRENTTLAIFVLVPNFWKTVNSGSPGGDEYVLSYIGDSLVEVSVLSDPCAEKICIPDYTCIECSAYDTVCNPADPTGLCIPGPRNTAKDYLCTADGYISISSTPPGASIYVDGLATGITGSTPTFVKVPVSGNPHSVELILATYETWIDTNVNASCTAPVVINPTLTVTHPTFYDLTIKLSSWTPGSYVINVLDKFTELLNEWVLTRISNVRINSVTYNEPNHEISVEIEEIPSSLSLSYHPYYSMPLQYPMPLRTDYIPLQYTTQTDYIPLQYTTQTDYSTKSLILPILLVSAIIWIAPYVALLVGLIVAYIFFGERPTVATYSSLQIKSVVLTNELSAESIEDVTIDIAGQTLTANAANSYTVTIANLEIGKTYPLKAYIPLSVDSKVYKALYEYNIKIQDLPMNLWTARLKIDTLAERDYRPCDLVLDNGSPAPVGTILRVFRPKTLANGELILDPLGSTTIGADGCAVDTIKVPAYLTDKLIKKQFISNSISPTEPSPTLVPGDQKEIPTVGGEKNIIGVIVQTTLKNNIVPDKIEIIDKSNGTIVKSVVPTEYTKMISGIPKGTFTISVTKSGYKYSACSLTPCEVTFTTDYLGSKTVTIILESLVTTCALNVYVEDKYRKPPKTETYISIDGKTEQLAPNGNLQISEITKGTHKFSVRAEGYKSITDENRNITCTTTPEIITFKLDQTEEIPVPESITLYVNDQRGSVKVDKSATITIKATGQDVTEDVKIYNISETPDLLIATLPIGQTETTLTVSDKDMTFELQAFQRCIAGICAKSSNIISLTVGVGEEECLVPGPFGTCLVRKTTGYGLMLLAGLGLLGIVMLARPGGAAEKIIERYPAPSPKEEIKAIPPEKKS